MTNAADGLQNAIDVYRHLESGHVTVAQDVVHLVRVEDARNDAGHVLALGRRRTNDVVGNPLEVEVFGRRIDGLERLNEPGRERFGADHQSAEDLVLLGAALKAQILSDLHEVDARPEHLLADVREGHVADVVQQGGKSKFQAVDLVEETFVLPQEQRIDELPYQGAHAEAVIEARVRSRRINLKDHPELANAPEPLDEGKVDGCNLDRLVHVAPVDGIVNDLAIAVCAWHVAFQRAFDHVLERGLQLRAGQRWSTHGQAMISNHYFLRTRRPLVCGCPDAAGRPAACLTGPTRPVIGAALSSRCEWVDAAHHVARRHATLHRYWIWTDQLRLLFAAELNRVGSRLDVARP